MSQLVAYIYPVAKRLQSARGKVELQIKTLIGSDFGDVRVLYFADRKAARAKAVELGAKAWNY